VSTFWIAAGALTLLVVAALAAPLLGRTRLRIATDAANIELYRDQLAELERDREQGVLSTEQFEQARAELGQRLLADVPAGGASSEPVSHASAGPWRFVALAAVPVVAVLTYLVLGVPDALDAKPAREGGTGHAQNLALAVERLAERLAKNPDDAEAWVLLARSKQMLGQPADAVKALAKAIALVPQAAPLWADYADMLAASANGEWTLAAKDALAKALSLDPAQPKALWLAGSEAYTRRDYRTALEYWEKLAPLTEPGSEVQRMIQANIAEARALASEGQQAAVPAQSAAAASGAAPAPAPAASGKDRALAGIVNLDPAIAARVQPGDTVFVFARAAQGPRMPLAIRRITVQELPYAFTLDDSAAMAPGMVISAFDQVVVGARVSRSGDATPKPGDFEGASAPVKPGTRGIAVTINAEIR
jgi:cytochrome c-type biogenesis protein CcmH